MVTFANAAQNREQSWCVIVTIEGIGDASGQWKFCSQRPDYGSSSIYKTWLAAWPDLLSERADYLGGVPEAGSGSFTIIDPDGDGLTSLLGMDADAVAALGTACTDSDTTLDLFNLNGIGIGTVIFIGAEAMIVTNTGFTSVDVTRGFLGTVAKAHDVGAPISLYTPFLRSRMVKVYLAPKDGDDASTEQLFGSFSLDRLGLSQDLTQYKISAKSQLKYLNRVVPRQPKTWKLTVRPDSPDDIITHAIWPADGGLIQGIDWGSSIEAWVLIGDSCVRRTMWSVSFPGGGSVAFLPNAELNTKNIDKIEDGATATMVYAADDRTLGVNCSFRTSPGPSPSTNRGSGTWNPTSHPIDVLLILLTSSYDTLDGLELVNADATYGNWSSLPAGYGAGVPVSELNIASFVAIRDTHPEWSIANFYFGHESEPIAEIITREILKPFGLYLAVNNGQIYAVLPRLPVQGETYPAVTISNVARTASGATNLPQLDLAYDGDSMITTVVFKTRENGADVSMVVINGDYKDGTYGESSYVHDESAIEIPISCTRQAFSTIAYDLAQRLLWRNQHPTFRATLEVDFSLWASKPGDTVTLTLQGPPSFRNRSRGWTARGCEILERAIKVAPDGGLRMAWTLLVYAEVNVGLIAPAASISSISGSGPYVVTCRANRFTDPDNTKGWPTTDAAAFTIGDVVQLANLDLSSGGGTTQTVLAIGTNTLTLDGNFGGALAANKLLRYANDSAATADQLASFVYTDSEDPGSHRRWRWAER